MGPTSKRALALLLAVAITLPPSEALAAAAVAAPPAGQATVIVTLKDRADLTPFRTLPRAARLRGVIQALQSRASLAQVVLRLFLAVRRAQGKVSQVTPLWISNSLVVTATADVIQELASHADVLTVTPDEVPVVPNGAPAGPTTWNVGAVTAPELWALGYTGQGVVVASLDTGVDASHPDLAGRWRGGSNSWFDPYGQHATPADASGHGTWTMGIMVGGDASGTTIGVAPDARWMAAKIFDDSGRATASAIHLAFQWVLDPDGNPATPDAPDLVNNSWAYGAPGCNLEFQRDLQALLAAGIVPVFAAGNYGPAAPSSVSPANYPEAFSVGAVDAAHAIYWESSRGPSACGGATFPKVVAPGVDVTTSDLFSLYTTASGSSLAAPHVSGVLALLVQAHPEATVGRLELALQRTALDLGAAGADNFFGSGLISARAALDDLATSPPPSPPVAVDDAFAAASGTLLTVAAPGLLANDSAPSGQPLTALLVGAPAHGTLALLPDGGFGYTSAAGYSGTDTFTYQASDGTLSSATATATLTVAPPPPPPVAAADAYTVAANTSATFTAPGVLANDSAPSGRALTASQVTSTAHGALLLQANGGFTYTPAAGYSGADGFSYRASDGLASSAVTAVTINVTPPPNQPPVARDDAASTRVSTAVTINVIANDSDAEGALVASSVAIVAGPKSGAVVRKTNGTVVYTPSKRFTGSDSFTYTVKDAAGALSNVATVRVTVR